MKYPTQEEITEAARKARFAEVEAISESLVMPPPTPAREANFKNLASLLKKFDRNEKLEGETEALRPRLEDEINTALESGDVQDESLAMGLATKRGQLELIPAKLAQLHAAREALLREIQAELTACFASFERRFSGMGAMLAKKVESFLRPLVADDSMLEYRIGSNIIPFAKPLRKAQGLIGRIRFPMSMGNWAEAARELLKIESESAEIIAEAEAFGIPSTKK